VERASRLIVIASIALAAVTHAWLVNWQPGLAIAAGLAFATLFVLARVSLPAALIAVVGSTFIAPALLAAAFHTSDYHQTIVWLGAFAGLLIARADLARWHVPRAWTAALATWAVIVALTWPIVAAREVNFSLVAAQTLETTNPLTQAPPRVAAAYVVILALSQLIGIVWIDFLWAHFASRLRDFGRLVVMPLVAGAVIGAFVGIYQRVIDFTWMNLPIWSNMQRAGGLMLDANAFGTGAAILAPVTIALAWLMGYRAAPAWGAFVVLGAGMWAAGSRTALLVFALGAGALAVAQLRERGLWHPRIGRIVALVGVTAFVVAAAVVPRDFASSNPLERAFSRVPRLEREEISRFATELWDRFGYGRAANQMLMEHPVSGVGVGAFHMLAPEYIYRERGRVFPSDNAQNWWRQQLAELGVLGAMPSIWFSGIVALLCWPGSVEQRGAATVLRGVMIGLGIASLFGVPTQGAAIIIAFGTLLFWLAAESQPRVEPLHSTRASVALLVVVVAVVAGVALSAQSELGVPARAIRSGVPYAYGWTAPQETSPYGDVRWMGREALTVEPTQRHWLRLTVWAPYADLAAQPVTFELRVNGVTRLARGLATSGPVHFAVDLGGAPAAIELRASRELLPDRALQIAMSWHEQRPAGIADDDVVQREHAEE
jgi:hypothetical protein